MKIHNFNWRSLLNLKTIEENQSLLIPTWIDCLLEFFVQGDSKFSESQMSEFIMNLFRKSKTFAYNEFLEDLEIEFSFLEYEDKLLHPYSSITFPLWENITVTTDSEDIPPDYKCTFHLVSSDMIRDSHFTFKNSDKANHIEKLIVLDGVEWIHLFRDRTWREKEEGLSYKIKDKV